MTSDTNPATKMNAPNCTASDSKDRQQQQQKQKLQSRVPLSLQNVFLISNRGGSVEKPPAEASKSFTPKDGTVAPTTEKQPRRWFRRKSIISNSKAKEGKEEQTSQSHQSRIVAVRDILNNMDLGQEEALSAAFAVMSPQQCLERLLEQRGYTVRYYDTLKTAYYNEPTPYQVASYGTHIVDVVKKGNLTALDALLGVGLSPNACNTHGESLVHLVCRLGHFEMLQDMIDHGCKVQVSDDQGKTPLHDICWQTTRGSEKPSMDAVGMLLEQDNAHMLFLRDRHGHTPLAYTQKQHWIRWIRFLECKANEYWPKRSATLHGEQKHPPLTQLPCNSKPIRNPDNALSVKLASMVANGIMKPEEANMIRDDDNDVSDTEETTSLCFSQDDFDTDDDDSCFDDDDCYDDEETDLLLNNLQSILKTAKAA